MKENKLYIMDLRGKILFMFDFLKNEYKNNTFKFH